MEDTTSTAVADTPAVSTPSAPSSETSAPATPSPQSRPASMKEAMQQTAAKRAASTEGAATTPPPATPDGSPASKKGPIPFDVHETSMKNAREKTAAERDAEWEAKTGWAKAVDRQRAEQALQIADLLERDSVGFLERTLAYLAQDPQQAAALRSLFGRQLAAGRGPTSAAPAELTPIQLQLEDGRVISVLPAEQLATFEQQVLQKASQQFQPAMDAAKKLEAAEKFATANAQATQFAGNFLGELTQLPQFKEHAKEIREALGQAKLETDHPAEVRAATLAIYNRIVVPKLIAQGSAQQLASLKSKAVAQTESPSGTAPALAKRPKNPQELAKFMEERANARKRA